MHPALPFYTVAATIIPVLFLAAMVELRYSITAREGMGADESGQPAFKEYPGRVAMFHLVTVSTLIGEISALDALWRGGGIRDDGLGTLLGLSGQGFVCVSALLLRSSADLHTNPVLERRVGRVFNVVTLMGGLAVLGLLFRSRL